MLELVDVEGHALALAGQLLAGAVTAALCPVVPCAAFGAHAVLPSADLLTFPSMLPMAAMAGQGRMSPIARRKGPGTS